VLSALQRMDGPIDVEKVCALLRDPEIDVQNKAIDVVIKANHPDTMRYLIEVLKDENENARRAAVEVLNEVGTAVSVKHLLAAHQGQRLVGAQPRGRCARQDRRPEGHRGRAAAGAR
jgi:HEAT repeat protein